MTLVPRPVNRPVECWQPIVSASPRGLDFMVRHGIKGAVGGGAATMAEGPIQAYREPPRAPARTSSSARTSAVGMFFYLAETREKAVREMTPYYEEHVKMFAPLGFVPGHHAGAGRSRRAPRRMGRGRRADASTTTWSSAPGSPARPGSSSST